jgi:phage recombination protein Bet
MSELTLAVNRNGIATVDADREQIDLVKQTVARGCSDTELQLFLYTAKRTGLDPLLRQIHAVKRWDSKAGKETMAIQTGIDGYRLVADRTERYAPGPRPTYTYKKDGSLQSAVAYVKKKTKDGEWHTVEAEAFWDEYVQTTKDGKPNSMWGRMSHIMLAKCAEALALRKAFPAELSGLYTHEEMMQADIDKPKPAQGSIRERVMKQVVVEQVACPPMVEGNGTSRAPAVTGPAPITVEEAGPLPAEDVPLSPPVVALPPPTEFNKPSMSKCVNKADYDQQMKEWEKGMRESINGGAPPLSELPIAFPYPSHDVVLGFGKMKGKKLSECPQDYLQWLAKSKQSDLANPGKSHYHKDAQDMLDHVDVVLSWMQMQPELEMGEGQ